MKCCTYICTYIYVCTHLLKCFMSPESSSGRIALHIIYINYVI